MIDENILKPALYCCNASGREQKPCLLCEKGFEKEERIIELFSSSYKDKKQYSRRFHYKCFLKVLAMKYPELLEDKFREELIKWRVIEGIK